MITTTNVMQVYNSFVQHDLLEDRREYTIDDLLRAYPELTMTEIHDLHMLVRSNFWTMTQNEDIDDGFAVKDIDKPFCVRCGRQDQPNEDNEPVPLVMVTLDWTGDDAWGIKGTGWHCGECLDSLASWYGI